MPELVYNEGRMGCCGLPRGECRCGGRGSGPVSVVPPALAKYLWSQAAAQAAQPVANADTEAAEMAAAGSHEVWQRFYEGPARGEQEERQRRQWESRQRSLTTNVGDEPAPLLPLTAADYGYER